MSKKRSTSKVLIILGAIIAISLLLFATCPDRNKHKEAISDAFNKYINNKINENPNPNDLFTQAGVTFFNGLVKIGIDNTLVVDNYGVVSIGYVNKVNGERQKVSFGLLGHVFTFSQEDLANAMEESFQE